MDRNMSYKDGSCSRRMCIISLSAAEHGRLSTPHDTTPLDVEDKTVRVKSPFSPVPVPHPTKPSNVSDPWRHRRNMRCSGRALTRKHPLAFRAWGARSRGVPHEQVVFGSDGYSCNRYRPGAVFPAQRREVGIELSIIDNVLFL